MKAITIINPYAHLVASGVKDIENRSWNAEKLIGQRIVIHAGKKKSSAHFARAEAIAGAPLSRELDYGAAIGTAVVSGIVTSHDSPWFIGPFGMVIRDAEIWPEPVPCLGQLGLWNFPDHLIPAGVFA